MTQLNKGKMYCSICSRSNSYNSTLVAQDLSCKFNFSWQIIEERDKETYKTTLILRAKDEVQVMLSKGCVNAINVLPRSWRLRYILCEIGLQFCNLIHVLNEFYHKRPSMLTVSILSKPNQIKETEIFKELIFLIFLHFSDFRLFEGIGTGSLKPASRHDFRFQGWHTFFSLRVGLACHI